MVGDWYARQMYIEGHAQYDHHCRTYGHPSEFGYIEIVTLWEGERWDPERLIDLYRSAGARYFVSTGVHHDNFDLWNSCVFRSKVTTHFGPKLPLISEQSYHLFRSESFHFLCRCRNGW